MDRTISTLFCYTWVEKHLHIISPTIPDPAFSDEEQDLYQAIIHFHELGIQIHLHCIEDGKSASNNLSKHCHSVHYYPRNLGHKGISHILPFMVSSRKNELLNQNLLKDNYPIYFQGIAATAMLIDPRFNNRKCFIRMIQQEPILYSSIAKSTPHFAKKIFFYFESILLKKFQKRISTKATIIGLEIPYMIPKWELTASTGMGSYCFFHGNLGAEEQSLMAAWLLKEVFGKIKVPFVIAGSYPSPGLIELAHAQSHTCLVPNPSSIELKDMMEKAHIHIIPSFSPTGNKYQLMSSLFHGRHCIVNEAAIAGTELGPACHVGLHARALQSIIVQIYHQPFQEEEINLRKKLLASLNQNKSSAETILQMIFG